MVRMGVLADALKTLYNAEKRGKRQVILRPSSKVIVKFLQLMQAHGKSYHPSLPLLLLLGWIELDIRESIHTRVAFPASLAPFRRVPELL